MTRVLDVQSPASMAFDLEKVRADFPILQQRIHGKPLVYFDNGATTQKPRQVIDAIQRYYSEQNANIHRAVHTLSQGATRAYDRARETIAAFLNARESAEVIFTRGTTEGINLVAAGLTYSLKAGDEIIVTHMEHHSNIVPWQIACQRSGAKLRVIPINELGELQLDVYESLLSEKTKIISLVHVSNSLGTINPVREMIQLARQKTQADILIDGAQHVAHFQTDVQALDCDYYVFSGHKIYGPTGIGILYGKRKKLEALPPYQSGGDMIDTVSFVATTYAELPNKFEAGTPHIEGAIGLAAAVEYVKSIGFPSIVAHEHDLVEYAQAKIGAIPGVRLIGTAKKKAEIVSFVVENPAISTYDLGMAFDKEGIAIRTGHHCCMPVMERLKVPSTARISLAVYNTREEIDFAASVLERIIQAEKKRLSSKLEESPAGLELKFPGKQAASIEESAEALLSDFELFDDDAGKNEYLEDLGKNLPPMPAALKTDATRVHGCMSIVHLFPRENPKGSFEFLADSDASTVRGLIGMMQRLFSGQRAADVLAYDINAFLKRLGIDRIVTTRRRIGLDGLIKKIREESGRIVGSSNG